MKTEKVNTTKQERDNIIRQAVELFNLAYDEYGIEDGRNLSCYKHEIKDAQLRDLTSDNLKLTQVTTKGGHLGIHESGDYWRLGINMYSWRNYWSSEQRLVVLLHELAHLPVTNHKHEPRFWDTFASGIQTALNNYDALTDIVEIEVRPDTVRDYAAQDVRGASGVENTDEQLEAFCEAIDYQKRDVKAFTSVDVVFADEAYENAACVLSLSDFSVPETYRDWRLHQAMNKQSPVNYFSGERIKFTRPIVVESIPDTNEQAIVKHRSGANIALIQRVAKLNTQDIDEIPVRER